jgi:hypothetical protein
MDLYAEMIFKATPGKMTIDRLCIGIFLTSTSKACNRIPDRLF